MKSLKILAGSRAYQHIKSRGLQPADLKALFGASGAAKWLGIYGLDRAIFSDWLQADALPTGQKLLLFGTSVGAFKLAAAARADPAAALDRLAESYIDQAYDDDVSNQAIVRETRRILTAVLGDQGVTEIFANPRFQFACGAVSCNGLLASPHPNHQKLAMLAGFALAITGRNSHRRMLERALFVTPEPASTPSDLFTIGDGFPTQTFELTLENFRQALLASGSIPVLMDGVSDIPGTANDRPGDHHRYPSTHNKHQRTRVFRDGGLLDYHPIPANLLAPGGGLILYPHFFPWLVPGWFDKFFPWRKAHPRQLEDVILVSPSEEFVHSLPNSRIPDRRDFMRYVGRDRERQQIWRQAAEQSKQLGEEWLELVNSGTITDRVEPM